MPTIIDSLIISLGFDASGAKKGAAEVVDADKKVRNSMESSSKDMDVRSRKLAQNFSKLRGEVLGLFAAFAGASGLKNFVSGMVEGEQSTGRLAANLGVSAQELWAWERAAMAAGGTAADADNAFRNISSTLQDMLQKGDPGAANVMNKLGLTAADLQNPAEMLLKIAAASERLSRPEFLRDMQYLGMSEPMTNLLVGGRSKVESQVNEFQKMAPTDEDNQRAIEFNRQMVIFAATIQDKVRPALTWLLEVFSDLATNHMPVLIGLMAGLAIAAAAPVAEFLALAAAITAVATAMGVVYEWATKGGTVDQAMQGIGLGLVQAATGDFSGAWSSVKNGLFPGAKAAPKKPAAVGPSAAGDSNYQWFRAHGMSDAAARGIAAGIAAEGGSANATNPTSGAYGLGQWMGPRRRDFQRVMGKSIYGSSIEDQRKFMLWEMQNSEKSAGSKIANADTAMAALAAYIVKFMRPAPGAETTGDLARGRAYLNRAGVAARSGTGGSNVANDTHIGQITVVLPNATDANGIARDLPGAIARRGVVTQASRGLN